MLNCSLRNPAFRMSRHRAQKTMNQSPQSLTLLALQLSHVCLTPLLPSSLYPLPALYRLNHNSSSTHWTFALTSHPTKSCAYHNREHLNYENWPILDTINYLCPLALLSILSARKGNFNHSSSLSLKLRSPLFIIVILIPFSIIALRYLWSSFVLSS